MLSRVYDIKPDTIRSWLYRPPLFSHWIDIVRKLNISDLFEILPPSYRDKYMQKKKDNNNLMFPKMSQIDLQKYERRLKKPQLIQQYFKLPSPTSSQQSTYVLKRKSQSSKSPPFSKKVKSRTPGRPRKYAKISEVIEKKIQNEWINGNPLCKNKLDQWIRAKFNSTCIDPAFKKTSWMVLLMHLPSGH